MSPSDFVGNYFAKPVSGGTPRQLGTRVWSGYASKGTQVVWNANLVPGTAGVPGTADLFVADMASANRPTLLATRAGASFYLSSDKTKVFYTSNAAAAGVYLVTLP